jgi:hypothetical protein
MRSYRCSTCYGDKYAGEFTVEAFRGHGIHYEHSLWNRSEIYLDMLPLINSRAVAFLDNERMQMQFVSLERTSVRGSTRDRVDHPRGFHDDIANAAAGALIHAFKDMGSGGVRTRILYPNLGLI